MAQITAKTKARKERGMALLLALFMILLLSAIGLFMVLSSNTETRIDANYSNDLRSHYAARSGLEEVRDRMKYPSNPTGAGPVGGLSDLLPQDVTGNANGVLYVLNPANGETVDPTDPNSPYFDDELCHDYNSGVVARDAKCAVQPTTPNWNLPVRYSLPSVTQLGYKWIRINMKTNGIADPYVVDGTAPPDARVCWDGVTEQVSPGGASPSCDANGMQTVYMLTSLAATSQTGGVNGSRSMLRFEVAAPSIRPAGMISMGATTSAAPVLSGGGIPGIAIDGRAHDVNGAVVTTSSCSAIAPLATNNGAGTTQLETALNLIRKSIVNQANSYCNADGSSTTLGHCTYGLWWARGTDPSTTRFVTSGSSTSNSGTSNTTSTTSTGTSTSGNGSSGSSGSGSSGGPGSDDGGGGGHHHHPSGAPDSGACDPTDRSCYTNLNLASPELFATSLISATNPIPADSPAPFAGGIGNQADATIYQPGSVNTISDEIQAVQNLVNASRNRPNYYEPSQATLAPSYGTPATPAIVNFTDQTLILQTSTLTGYGVLMIPSGLEISSSLQWHGIVMIQSASGHVNINPGATGSINGALLMQPGAALNLQTTSVTTSASGISPALPTFSLTYSCDAVDLPFGSTPFKVISSTESSH